MSQQERWQVSGNASEAYERYLVPTMFTPWAHDLIERAALQSGERVIDVACGTGIVARLAAEAVGSSGQVVGVDLNAGMIEMARSQTPSSGAPVEWREGDVNALPYNDATFDVLLCQQGFQFFPDQAKAIGEMYRVLTPGGRLALSVWRSVDYNPYFRAISDALERHVSAEVAAGMRAVCSFGEAEALRMRIADAGFRDVRIQVVILTKRHPSLAEYIPGQLSALPFAGAIQALEAETQANLLNDIVESLKPYTDDEGLAAPLEAHIAMAWK